MDKEAAESRLILKVVSGSRAYGTEVEESDIDYRGVVIPPKSYFLGLETFEQYESKDPDVVYYHIKKFLRLALKGNPNILELVFTDIYEVLDEFGQRLIDMREQFLTQRCATAYMGFATSQLKKMRNVAVSTSRNYKCAMHMVRLCRTGIEVLRDGKLLVRRPDAADLVEIRNGKYTLEEVLEYGEHLLEDMKGVAKTSMLPKEPDYNYVNQQMIRIVEEYLDGND
jgi:predicted nucleotidyltransferase